MNIPTQEEYSKLTTEEKFLLAVNAFKATCDVLFETDVQYEIEICGVDFKYIAELAKGNEDKISRSENALCGVWHSIKLSTTNRRQLKVSTFKFSS